MSTLSGQTATDSNASAEINKTLAEQYAQQKAQQTGLPYVDLSRTTINPDALSLLSLEQASQAKLVTFALNDSTLQVAMIDQELTNTKEILANLSKKYTIVRHICSEISLQLAYEWYQNDLLNHKHIDSHIILQESHETTAQQTAHFQALEKNLPTLEISAAIREIIALALGLHATDIHLQPDQGFYLLRFRLDGLLQQICQISTELALQLATRLKYDGGMHPNVKDAPQDGRSVFTVNDAKIDIRLSTIPTPQGESIVMRILDSGNLRHDFSQLGFSSLQIKKIKDILAAKNGLVVVSGPTGAGKTTTLYTMLGEVNTTANKIVTIEDPIEYYISGVTQSQADTENNYGFEQGLRSILRHDPDVILVGEIRDTPTAKLSLESAQTGHLVLSSLHTNSALGAIVRLSNLNIENYNIANALRAVVAQRLVRRLCKKCLVMTAWKPEPELAPILEILKAKTPSKRAIAKGCDNCSHTGYQGRLVILELIEITPPMAEMIRQHKSEPEMLQHVVQEQAFENMFTDGLRKVLSQETTLEELYRVLG